MSSQETKSSQRKEEVSAAAVAPQGLAAHPLVASGEQRQCNYRRGLEYHGEWLHRATDF
jgi:hypothetical protein